MGRGCDNSPSVWHHGKRRPDAPVMVLRPPILVYRRRNRDVKQVFMDGGKYSIRFHSIEIEHPVARVRFAIFGYSERNSDGENVAIIGRSVDLTNGSKGQLPDLRQITAIAAKDLLPAFRDMVSVLETVAEQS